MIDAFRVESLDKNEQAAGMASYVAAYRIGMLASTVGVLYLVAVFELFGFANTVAWKLAFLGMAVLVLIGIVATIAATEPAQSAVAETAHAGEKNSVARVAQAAYHAFADFLTRDAAFVVLLFVVLYKFCDAFAGVMTAAFVIKIGFSIVDYANIVKGVGLAASLIGGFAGGALAMRYNMVTCLWIGAILQMMSNLAFTWLALVGTNHWVLVAAIIAENLHRRHRHRDLRRLPLGAVPEPAAHRDPVRLADRAIGRRTHLSVGRRRHRRGSDRLADVLCVLFAARNSEPVPARLAATARAFCRARARARRPRGRLMPLAIFSAEISGNGRCGRIRSRRCSPAYPSSRSS